MKKLLLFIVLLFPFSVKANSARNMIAMDMETNRVLYEKNAYDPNLIASITKIMTAIIAIENKDLESDVKATDTILKSFGSGIYIEVGETMKLKDLLYGLMLRSGNDAALAIAEYVGGSVDKFVDLMNKKASELGMNNTKFINPHGLENNDGKGNTSTAYDMAILTSYAMKNSLYQEIVKTKKYMVTTDKKTYSWTNKNKLLSMYEYTTGGKTGYTEKAKRTLVSTASKDNKNIVIVTLNDGNDWDDHINMYENIFNEYNNELIIAKDNFKIEKEDYYKNDANLYIQEDVYLLLKENEKKDISLNINLNKLSQYKDGDVVGTIEVKLKDQTLKEVKIYISKQEEKKEKKTLWERILGWFKHD